MLLLSSIINAGQFGFDAFCAWIHVHKLLVNARSELLRFSVQWVWIRTLRFGIRRNTFGTRTER